MVFGAGFLAGILTAAAITVAMLITAAFRRDESFTEMWSWQLAAMVAILSVMAAIAAAGLVRDGWSVWSASVAVTVGLMLISAVVVVHGRYRARRGRK